MKTRAVLALSAIIATGLSAGAANAVVKKPKPLPPVCNLITDAPGDTGIGVLTAAPSAPVPDDSLDVVSADIASDATYATAVIRVKALAASDPQAVGGRTYFFEFNAPGADANVLFFGASLPTTGANTFEWGDITNTAGQDNLNNKGAAVGAIVGNEIHISVALKDLKAAGVKFDKGSKISNLSVTTGNLVGLAPGNPADNTTPAGPFYGYEAFTLDSAVGTKAYTAAALSCVKPGK
ncbi:MAG: hypothetical protein QOJ92_1567 [Frankiales bacterium]|nr:hypothetical protein [Frankiales bacterium]